MTKNNPKNEPLIEKKRAQSKKKRLTFQQNHHVYTDNPKELLYLTCIKLENIINEYIKQDQLHLTEMERNTSAQKKNILGHILIKNILFKEIEAKMIDAELLNKAQIAHDDVDLENKFKQLKIKFSKFRKQRAKKILARKNIKKQ